MRINRQQKNGDKRSREAEALSQMDYVEILLGNQNLNDNEKEI